MAENSTIPQVPLHMNIQVLSIETRAIHADNKLAMQTIDSSSSNGALSPMMSTATTFDMNASNSRFVYTRDNQPTRARLEHLFTKLEGGTSSIIYPSGVSAIRSLFEYYKPTRIISNRGYKGSLNAINDLTQKVELLPDDKINVEYFEQKLEPKLSSNDIVFLEIPSNPYLRVFDIESLCKYIRTQNCKLVVDATVSTPIVFQPFKYGADIVIHSLTKYISGHSDVCGGVTIFNYNVNTSLCADAYKLHSLRTRHGNIMGNLETWLLLRSIRTLSSRIRIQSANACQIAEFLANKENTMGCVESVYHTSLKTHPDYHLAQKYFERDTLYFTDSINDDTKTTANAKNDDDDEKAADSENERKGRLLHPGMICIICSTEPMARALVKKFDLVVYATSFGGVETSIDLRSKFDSEIDPRCLRLSVGLESYVDIINDFRNAFQRVQQEQSAQAQHTQSQDESTSKSGKKKGKFPWNFSSKK